MGEEQAVVGGHWTEEAVALLERLGWQRHGALRVDVPCTLHKSKRKGPTHGLDAVMSYYDPFSQQRVGVIVETKRYAWDSITPANLQEWVDTLTESLECAPYSKGFTEPFSVDGIPFTTAFLMIECNTPEKYDKDKFLEKLRSIKIPRKNADLRIFVASNEELGFIKSLTVEMERLGHDGQAALFLYPSIEGSTLVQQQGLTLEMMYSRFILGIAQYEEKEKYAKYTKNRAVVFLREHATPVSLRFAYLTAKYFQLEMNNALTFYLYEPWGVTRVAAEGFLKEIEGGSGDCKVNVQNLEHIEAVPK